MPNNPSSLQARRDAMVQKKMTELGLKYSCDMDPADWMSMCEEAKDACLSDLLRQLDELGRALAESEAKVRELEEGDEALRAVLPEDFGAVEYIKHLTAANAALEEKLSARERDLREAKVHMDWQQTELRKLIEASRKKGAEHGE